jgi:hypothetical protein
MGKINLSSANGYGHYYYEIELANKNLIITEKSSKTKDLVNDNSQRRLYINVERISSIDIKYGDYVAHERTSLKPYIIAALVILAVGVGLFFVHNLVGILFAVLGIAVDVLFAIKSRKGNGGLRVVSKGNSTHLSIIYDSSNRYEREFHTADDTWYKQLVDLLDDKDASKVEE